jgi:hypothetical protein
MSAFYRAMRRANRKLTSRLLLCADQGQMSEMKSLTRCRAFHTSVDL